MAVDYNCTLTWIWIRMTDQYPFSSSSKPILNKCSSRFVQKMSSEPAVEFDLDFISLILPLPFRVALAVVFGVWAWGLALQYFSLIKIDVPLLINPQREVIQASPPAYISTYRLAFTLTAPLVLSLFLFWSLSHGNSSLVIYYDFLPISYLLILIGILLLPIRPLCSPGRSRFISTLRRISIGGLAQTKDGKFADIMLADVLTSYAKIIADLFVVLCMFLSKESRSATARPNRSCGSQYLIPIITAIPYLIRLRQCLIEFFRAHSTGGLDSGVRHLANALKYTTGFPVIALSALYHNVSSNLTEESDGLTRKSVYYCWLTAIFINSSYSFYWDVAKDWDLALFPAFSECLHINKHSKFSNQYNVPRHRKKTSFGLRPRLFLPYKEFYYLAIFLDLFLRFSWLINLSPLTVYFANSEGGITLLQFAEVGRRWMWIFLRSDAEWARQYEEKEDPVLNNILYVRQDDFEGSE